MFQEFSFFSGFSLQAEDIEWYLEDQAFSHRMIMLLPHYLRPPLPSVSSIGEIQEDWERDTVQLADGWEGEEPNHTTKRKPALYNSFNTLWLQELEYKGMYHGPCKSSKFFVWLIDLLL